MLINHPPQLPEARPGPTAGGDHSPGRSLQAEDWGLYCQGSYKAIFPSLVSLIHHHAIATKDMRTEVCQGWGKEEADTRQQQDTQPEPE